MATQQIVVIGAGPGGLSVAQRLLSAHPEISLTLIEPSDTHFYQSLWTLVGGGVFPKEHSRRPMASLIPNKARWVQDAVADIKPDEQTVTTHSNGDFNYDYLVVAPGLQILWNAVPGLVEALGRGGVCSNYSFETVNNTWDNIQSFRNGTALFTFPNTPVKCAAAPLKIMFLAEDYWRRANTREQVSVKYFCATPTIFRAPKYAAELMKIALPRDIDLNFKIALAEIRGTSREAVFRSVDGDEERIEKYDMIHVTPPMGPPDFIKKSPLADSAGWVDVDKATMQHVRYPNVFSLGDASNLPTSKTAAAIRAQSPVLVGNLLAVMRGSAPPYAYNGYTSCPLITGYGRLVLAEFDYDLEPCETFPFDQGRERASMYFLKKNLLPSLYWNALLKGRKWYWPIPETAPPRQV